VERPEISLIVAMDLNRVIGRGGLIPWHLPIDLKHFRDTTKGHPVIIGRKTFESIIEFLGKPLPGRTNIVMSRNEEDYKRLISMGADYVVRDSSGALERARIVAKEDGVGEVFVIGGSSVYEEFLPIADRIYLTRIMYKFEGDTHFPHYDGLDWERTFNEIHRADEDNPYDCAFIILQRRMN